ncbi:hypothetical protein Tsubulata_040474 [Turnera subulata]|uniref:Non-specific lipid-transfer protein n=1 Tax=Turnera subulata TaxID=218843 RepID=A0A9Q0FR21_9ROSI|nr:hypothetical protein Tsubulata_040474 [Turnera subulata]
MAVKLACVVLMCMFAGALAQTISCGQVMANLLPCVSLVTGGAPTAACCRALNSTVAQASTTAGRQQLCSCLKAAFGGLNLNLADLKAKVAAPPCGVEIPFDLTTKTNCSLVQ